ncbi:MAG: hypothetical protein V4695_05170 [Pseudomonadota bacterium]
MNEKLLPLIVALCATLAGCGGGGGGSSTPPPSAQQPVPATPGQTTPSASAPTSSPTATAPTVPIEAAISKLYTTNETYRLTADAGSINQVSYTRQFVVLPNTTFENQTVQSVEITNTSQPRSGAAVVLKQTDYFTTSPYVLVGRKFAEDTGSARTVTQSRRLLPVNGRPGDADFFYDSVTYSQDGQVVYNTKQTWDVTADPDSPTDTATFCILPTVTFFGIPGERAGNSDCYKINTAGTVTAVKFISGR